MFFDNKFRVHQNQYFKNLDTMPEERIQDIFWLWLKVCKHLGYKDLIQIKQCSRIIYSAAVSYLYDFFCVFDEKDCLDLANRVLVNRIPLRSLVTCIKFAVEIHECPMELSFLMKNINDSKQDSKSDSGMERVTTICIDCREYKFFKPNSRIFCDVFPNLSFLYLVNFELRYFEGCRITCLSMILEFEQTSFYEIISKFPLKNLVLSTSFFSNYESCVHPQLINEFVLVTIKVTDQKMTEFGTFTNLTNFCLLSCPGVTDKNSQILLAALSYVPCIEIS